jgi:Tfp pilus assembly PilM family ATPase
MDLKALLKKIKPRGERIGIDLTGRGVKVVHLTREGDESLALVASDFVDIDVMNASPMDMHKLKTAIQQVLGHKRAAAFSIEHPSLRIRCMTLANMPERDLLEAIRWNFREHIDVPLDQYTVGYTPIRKSETDGQQLIVAYGASKESIDRVAEIGKSMGCKPVALEPVATALLAAFDANLTWEEDKYVAAVLIDDRRTQFTVMSNGKLLFSRPIQNASIETLENLTKRETPENAFRRFCSQLVIETQRSIDAFCIMFETEHVDELYVCGKGSKYTDLIQHMERTLGLKTQAFNPFERISMPESFKSKIGPWASAYSVAVGLSIP